MKSRVPAQLVESWAISIRKPNWSLCHFKILILSTDRKWYSYFDYSSFKLITTEFKAGIKKQNCTQQDESGLLRNRLRAPNRQPWPLNIWQSRLKDRFAQRLRENCKTHLQNNQSLRIKPYAESISGSKPHGIVIGRYCHTPETSNFQR